MSQFKNAPWTSKKDVVKPRPMAAAAANHCMAVNPSFHGLWNEAAEIPFHAKWNNGTGCYDGAAVGKHAPSLAVGETARATSPGANNRKMLLLGTAQGNIVFFQRYSGGEGAVIVTNHPDGLPRAIRAALDGSVDDQTLQMVAGWAFMNA